MEKYTKKQQAASNRLTAMLCGNCGKRKQDVKRPYCKKCSK